jgi:hypothetical protein
MVPVLQGTIARRILLNFRADPAVAAGLVPAPFEPRLVNGQALVGVCLLRVEHARPVGVPGFLGYAAENMAHRVGVNLIAHGSAEPAVYIPRRDTESPLIRFLGERLFFGEHHRSRFAVAEDAEGIRFDILSDDGRGDVHLEARWSDHWRESGVFESLDAASEYFRSAPCGYSPAAGGARLNGSRIDIPAWHVEPLEVTAVASAFYDRFPKGSVVFDHALIMRNVPHTWHEMPAPALTPRAA